MIAALLLLAHTGSIPADDAAPEEAIEPMAAAQLFVDACWRGLRDRRIFESAIAGSGLGFKPAPTDPWLQRFRASKADLRYSDGICHFVVKVGTEPEVDTFIDMVTRHLGVAAPSRGWGMDRRWLATVQWRDVPIAYGVYRWRGTIQHPTSYKGETGPYVIDISLGFTNFELPS